MSLLLDALQRASKDKEKAALAEQVANTASLATSSSPGHAAQNTTPGELTLTEKTAPPSPLPTLVQEPEMSLTWEELPATATTPAVPVAPTPTAQANPARMAQEIRRAYAPPTAALPALQAHKEPRRVWVWVGIAITAALVAGGLAWVWWANASHFSPATIPQPVVAATGVSPAPVAGPVPADIEPVQAAAPVPAASAKPQAAPAAPVPAAPVPAATMRQVAAPASVNPGGNDVLVHGDATATSAFSSKTRSPSPLEQGYAALVAGRLDEAVQSYNQALKANPEERDALLGLAYIAQQKGLRDDAQGLYRRVLRQEPHNAIASAALLALDADADSGQTASRARDLAMRQPDSAATMAIAGAAAVREGLLADAVQLFARAYLLEPSNALYAYNHAVALDRLGQFAAATAQYEKVLQLSEKLPASVPRAFSVQAVRDRLAQLHQALGLRVDIPK